MPADEDTLHLHDPRDIRALAHPARMAIIDALASGDELTATECAALTGLSPSATAYHLKLLERYDLAEPAAARSDGRERPWRATDGRARIDLDAREVRLKGEPVGLGPLEFKLLEYFVRNPGVALSRDQILREVYEYDAEIATDRVDLLVRRLRSKLGWSDRLVAVPGYGYRLERSP